MHNSLADADRCSKQQLTTEVDRALRDVLKQADQGKRTVAMMHHNVSKKPVE
jgi:hypothetical protein